VLKAMPRTSKFAAEKEGVLDAGSVVPSSEPPAPATATTVPFCSSARSVRTGVGSAHTTAPGHAALGGATASAEGASLAARGGPPLPRGPALVGAVPARPASSVSVPIAGEKVHMRQPPPSATTSASGPAHASPVIEVRGVAAAGTGARPPPPTPSATAEPLKPVPFPATVSMRLEEKLTKRSFALPAAAGGQSLPSPMNRPLALWASAVGLFTLAASAAPPSPMEPVVPLQVPANGVDTRAGDT
jgi:hypothetical protein